MTDNTKKLTGRRIIGSIIIVLILISGCVSLKEKKPSPGNSVPFTAISAGFGEYGLAVKNDGTPVCWGQNLMAYSDFSPHGVCDIPGTASDVRMISAGAYSVLALKEDGTVLQWGGTREIKPVPSQLSGVRSIDNAGDCSLALKDDGSLVAWNCDQGIDPGVLSNLTNIKVVSGNMALKKDGSIVIWDRDGIHPVPPSRNLSGIVSISWLRAERRIALRNDGRVVEIPAKGSDTLVPGLDNVRAIAAGLHHHLVLKNDGTVASWNETAITSVGLTHVAEISSDGYFDLALLEDGTITAWGDNEYGQLFVPGKLTGVRAVSAGSAPNLVLKNDGTILSWGFDSHSKKGLDPTGIRNCTGILVEGYEYDVLMDNKTLLRWGESAFGPCPVTWIPHPSLALFSACNVPFVLQENGNLIRLSGNTTNPGFLPLLENVTSVSSSVVHTLALKKDGTVTGWGISPLPGPGRDTVPDVPKDLSGVIGVASTSSYDLALLENGTIIGWGQNNQGQLDIPRGLSDVSAIAAGGDCGYALTKDGTIIGWGGNQTGFCRVPAGLHDVVAISAGQYNTLALKKDGTVVSWGEIVIPDWSG